MSWSYDSSDLVTTTASGRLNVVRLLLGDTDTTDQQVQDEEVTFALSENNDNVYTTASWLARVVASKYSRLIDSQLDGALQAKYSDLAKQYSKLSKDLEAQGKRTGATLGVASTGTSIAEVKSVRTNTDRVAPSFARDQFKNPPYYSYPDYNE